MFKLFAPIFKVDVAKREVYGVMAEEKVDKSNQIFDYDSSKPYVKTWVEGFEKSTDGKSFGNVRAMHSAIAAGKLTGVEFDDSAKKINVVAKIVDDNEWKKVEEGVYTGFSIGGKYIKKWMDGTAERYTANLSEVSIVDNPCMHGAKFTMVKADGAEEQREFTKSLWDVGRCADICQSLSYLHDTLQFEAEYENDGSMIPGRLKAEVESLVAILIDLAVEEGRELTAALAHKFAKFAKRKEEDMTPQELEKRLKEVKDEMKKDFDADLKKMSEAHHAHLSAMKTHLDGASEHLGKCMGEGAEKSAASAAPPGFVSIGKAADGTDMFKRDATFVPAAASGGGNDRIANLESAVEKLVGVVEKIAAQPATRGAVVGAATDSGKGGSDGTAAKTGPIRFVPGGATKADNAMDLMKKAQENAEPVTPELIYKAAK